MTRSGAGTEMYPARPESEVWAPATPDAPDVLCRVFLQHSLTISRLYPGWTAEVVNPAGEVVYSDRLSRKGKAEAEAYRSAALSYVYGRWRTDWEAGSVSRLPARPGDAPASNSPVAESGDKPPRRRRSCLVVMLFAAGWFAVGWFLARLASG